MGAVDFIVKYIEEQGITKEKAAAIVGCSRQCLWDKLNKGNPRIQNMIQIFTAFGFDLHIVHIDGRPVGFDEEHFISAAPKNMYFGDLEKIINSMGYRFEFVRKV